MRFCNKKARCTYMNEPHVNVTFRCEQALPLYFGRCPQGTHCFRKRRWQVFKMALRFGASSLSETYCEGRISTEHHLHPPYTLCVNAGGHVLCHSCFYIPRSVERFASGFNVFRPLIRPRHGARYWHHQLRAIRRFTGSTTLYHKTNAESMSTSHRLRC